MSNDHKSPLESLIEAIDALHEKEMSAISGELAKIKQLYLQKRHNATTDEPANQGDTVLG